MENTALKTSLRSEIHATDSTCNGWIANIAATKKLCQRVSVMARSMTNNRMTVVVCKKTLVKWCPAGLKPNNWQSNMCEMTVSGCQLPIIVCVKAQVSPGKERPPAISAFS